MNQNGSPESSQSTPAEVEAVPQDRAESYTIAERNEFIADIEKGKKKELFESVNGVWGTLTITLKEYYNPASAASGTQGKKYETLFRALERSMISDAETRLAVKIDDLVSEGISPDVAKENLRWFAIRETQKLDGDLQAIAASDGAEGGKISLLDIQRAGNISESAMFMLDLLTEERSMNKAEVRAYIVDAVMKTATQKKFKNKNIEEQEGHASNPTELLRQELEFVTMYVVGSEDMTADDYEQMLAEVAKELRSTEGTGHFSDVQDSLEKYLQMDEVLNEKTGEYDEVPRAVALLREHKQEIDDVMKNADASGTLLGRRGDLSDILLYLIKEIPILGFFAQQMNPNTKGGSSIPYIAAYAAMTEMANPGTMNNLFGEIDYSVATKEQARELATFPGVEPTVATQLEDWALAIDPKYFSTDNKELTNWLKTQRIHGDGVDFSYLARFLSGESIEAGGAKLDGVVSVTSPHAPIDRMKVHDLPYIQDPKARQAMFNFLWSAAAEHHTKPSSLLN